MSTKIFFFAKTKKISAEKKAKKGERKRSPPPQLPIIACNFVGGARQRRAAGPRLSPLRCKREKVGSLTIAPDAAAAKTEGFVAAKKKQRLMTFVSPLFSSIFLSFIFSFIAAKAPSSSSSSLLFALVQSGNGEEKRRREKYQFVRFGRRQLANWQMPRCPIPFPFSPLTFQQSNLRLSRVHTRTGAPIGRGENR